MDETAEPSAQDHIETTGEISRPVANNEAIATSQTSAPNYFLSFYSSELITLNVGQGQALYTAHRTQLEHSPFFSEMLQERWTEGRQKHIDLPEDEPDVVRGYLHPLYRGAAYTDPDSTTTDPQEALAELYVFSRKFCDSHCANQLIAAFAQVLESSEYPEPSWSAVRIIYNGTTAHDPRGASLIEQFLSDDYSVEVALNNYWGNWPKEFEEDVVHEAFMRRDIIRAGGRR